MGDNEGNAFLVDEGDVDLDSAEETKSNRGMMRRGRGYLMRKRGGTRGKGQ